MGRSASGTALSGALRRNSRSLWTESGEGTWTGSESLALREVCLLLLAFLEFVIVALFYELFEILHGALNSVGKQEFCLLR